ncbi:MAG TPA: twin-arginine translocase subunit TatC [Anaerolineae bacterium]|nr:twin-arginine translocase subunit TatC [Anaerolineae bacterium]HID84529.1 twin-arginine translocase subunit TatC [Anaerolineales bacterium]
MTRLRKVLRGLLRVLFAPIWLPWRAIRGLARWLYRTRRRLWEALTAEPEERPLPDVLQATFEEPSAVLYHLNDLRRHLLRAAGVWVLMTAVAFAFTPRLIDFLAAPIGGIHHLQAIEVTEPVIVFVRVALLAGFAFSLPYIYFELYLFAAPGLRPRGRILGLLGMPFVLIFFVGGMAFAYYVMLPVALPFLLNFMGIPTLPRPASYIKFVTSLLFWVGVAFEFPLAIYLLASVGWVRAEDLVRHWRVAVVVIAVLAAVITPTVDPVNMLLVMAPMIVLYLLGIGLARLARL